MCNGLASACIYRERSSRYGEKDQATEFLHTLSLEYFDSLIKTHNHVKNLMGKPET